MSSVMGSATVQCVWKFHSSVLNITHLGILWMNSPDLTRLAFVSLVTCYATNPGVFSCDSKLSFPLSDILLCSAFIHSLPQQADMLDVVTSPSKHHSLTVSTSHHFHYISSLSVVPPVALSTFYLSFRHSPTPLLHTSCSPMYSGS
jgi:hypothetical protein